MSCDSEYYQSTYGVDVANGNVDSDGDGVSDLLECEYDSNPLVADSDNDGVLDGVEILDLHSDPNSSVKNSASIAIVSPENNQITHDSTLFVKGVAPAGQNVKLIVTKLKEDDEGQLTRGASSQFDAGLTSQNGVFIYGDGIELLDGKYSLVASSINPNSGKKIYSKEVVIEVNTDVDTGVLKITQLGDKVISDDVFLKDLRVELVDNKPVVRGITNVGNKAVATWNSAVFSSAVVADIVHGDFAIQSPEILAPGEHNVYVTSIKMSDNSIMKSVKLPFVVTENDLMPKTHWWDCFFDWWCWILLIIAFGLVLGLYFWVRKRKK